MINRVVFGDLSGRRNSYRRKKSAGRENSSIQAHASHNPNKEERSVGGKGRGQFRWDWDVFFVCTSLALSLQLGDRILHEMQLKEAHWNRYGIDPDRNDLKLFFTGNDRSKIFYPYANIFPDISRMPHLLWTMPSRQLFSHMT